MNDEVQNIGEKGQKRTIIHFLLLFAVVLFIVYAVYTWVAQRAEVEEIDRANQELTQQIVAAQQQCDEYTRILNSEDESAYMERIAIEKYGYGYPGEHRYYFTNKE